MACSKLLTPEHRRDAVSKDRAIKILQAVKLADSRGSWFLAEILSGPRWLHPLLSYLSGPMENQAMMFFTNALTSYKVAQRSATI
jgi:hypothetical protein